MRLVSLVFACSLLVLSAPSRAQEYVDLKEPVGVDPGTTTFRPAVVVLNWRDAYVSVQLHEVASGAGYVPGGKTSMAEYRGQEATDMMTAINKANLTTRSMMQRIMDKLIADGKIPPGTVTGTVP